MFNEKSDSEFLFHKEVGDEHVTCTNYFFFLIFTNYQRDHGDIYDHMKIKRHTSLKKQVGDLFTCNTVPWSECVPLKSIC